MRMNKKPLNLLVNTDLVDKAKKHGINLSAFFELKLQEHLDYYYGNRKIRINRYGPKGIRTPVTGSEGR